MSFRTIIIAALSLTIANTCLADTASVARTEAWKAIGNGASSISMAVMDGEKIVYAEALGMIDREKSIAANTDTQYNIGSVSKIFTAAAILQLCERGKVYLDKPVTQYLPEFKMKDPRYGQITVRMLLNHSTAMPGTNSKDACTAAKNRNYIAESLRVLQESYLKSDPGEISVYCNDGFTVAEAVVERVSGMSFADYLSKNIFQKAGMNNTSCYFRDGNTNIARVYDSVTGMAKPYEYANPLGSGGVSSTASDMCRYCRALYDGKILKPESIKEYTSLQSAPDSVPAGKPLITFGLGWDDVEQGFFAAKGVKVLGKNGGTFDFFSQLFTAPKEGLTAVALVAGKGDPGSIDVKVLQTALEDKGILRKSETEAALPPKAAAIPADLYRYAGFYGSGENIIQVKFDKAKNTIVSLHLTGGQFVPEAEFIYIGKGRFRINDDANCLLATRDGRKYLMMEMSKTAQTMVMAESISPAKADTSAFAGKTWVPTNFKTGDLGAGALSLCRSGEIKELPGVIYLAASPATTIAYGLSDKYTGKMILPHIRDLSGFRVDIKTGVLSIDAYRYVDAQKVPSLSKGEKITIGKDGYNAARKITSDTVFSYNIPPQGRIMVFSPDGTVAYDSLIEGDNAQVLEPGFFVLFIGGPDTVFEAK